MRRAETRKGGFGASRRRWTATPALTGCVSGRGNCRGNSSATRANHPVTVIPVLGTMGRRPCAERLKRGTRAR